MTPIFSIRQPRRTWTPLPTSELFYETDGRSYNTDRLFLCVERGAVGGVIDSALYPFSPEIWNSHSLAGFNMDGMTTVLKNAMTDHDGYTRG